MGNAIWLLMALPSWYLDAAKHPFATGALTLVPAIGMLSLLIGLALLILSRRRELLWFLSLFVLSEGLVALAGLMRGWVSPRGSIPLAVGEYGFLAVQLAICAYLIYRTAGARLSATAFTVFSATYALAAVFVAAMSFTDTWL